MKSTTLGTSLKCQCHKKAIWFWGWLSHFGAEIVCGGLIYHCSQLAFMAWITCFLFLILYSSSLPIYHPPCIPLSLLNFHFSGIKPRPRVSQINILWPSLTPSLRMSYILHDSIIKLFQNVRNFPDIQLLVSKSQAWKAPDTLYSTLSSEHIVTSTCRQTHMLSIQKEKVLHFPTKHREKLVILRDRGMIGLARPLSLPSTCTCQGPFSSSNICHIIKHKSGGNVSKPAEGKANALPSSAASSTPELQCHWQINPGHLLGLQHGLECWFLVILATACSEAVIFWDKEEKVLSPFQTPVYTWRQRQESKPSTSLIQEGASTGRQPVGLRKSGSRVLEKLAGSFLLGHGMKVLLPQWR